MHVTWSSAPQSQIDRLREELFVRAECFLEGLDAGRPAELEPLVRRLMSVARAQFAVEERLLDETRAASLVRHAHEHATFLADLEAIAQLANRGDADALAALRPAAWLMAWLATHGRTDRELPIATPPPVPRVRVAV
jgi:hemerythrin